MRFNGVANRGPRCPRGRGGFTLPETLVVLAVAVILVALVMPVISQSRVRGRQTACAAALSQIGAAYATYAAENHGWWPMALHEWLAEGSPPIRTKRWHDFISPYVGTPINNDGDQNGLIARYRQRSVLWGCPSWEPLPDEPYDPGYSMNIYPNLEAGVGLGVVVNGVRNQVTRRVLIALDGPEGWYFKASQWTRPAERCLVYDSINADSSIAGWPWWRGNGPMPARPHRSYFSADFNRHSGRSSGTRESTPSINALFCDGHVKLLSAKELYKAIFLDRS